MAEKLTPEQQLAVTDRDGKLLVSAAAGSGKTKVLVDRLLSYLTDANDPANLDEFLIITYTKAAASELRGKIAAKLTERIAEMPQSRHLQQQMQRLYLAKISTVHSFCADILREYAYRLDIAADFRVADEMECQEIQLQVMEKLLDAAYETAGDNPDFRAFADSQGFGRDDRQIPQIILKVYNSARCHLNPEQWLAWCETSADTEGMTDAGKTLWGSYLIADLHAYLDLHIDALRKCADRAASTEGMEKPAALLDATIQQLTLLRGCSTWDEIVANKQIDYGRLTFPKNCTDLVFAEKIKAVRNACKKGLEKKLRCFADMSSQVLSDLQDSCAAARGLIALVRQFDAEYDKRKRSRRILDFGDLEHKMLDLLLGKRRSGPTALADEIGARYREIMVDEYQDSNSVQDAIFGALTRKRQNCFMVGDVKQSIYQFRLADPGIFVEKYNAFVPAESAAAGEGRKVLLSRNFRSSGGVISAVNDVFGCCMSPEVGGLHYGDAEMLREGIPHIPLPEPEVELHTIPVQEDTYAEEAAFAAERICTLLDGKHTVRQGDTLHPIKPEDIVILLRSPGSVGGEFAYALEQRGIRCTTGGSVDLLQTEEIAVLRSLLQIINNPLQDIPLIAVLSSRVFGFTADELAGIRGQNRRVSIFDALHGTRSEKVSTFLTIVNDLRQEARLYPLSQFLQRVFAKTRLDSIYAAMPDGGERTENLQIFCQLAAEYETSGRKDLSQFLDHLNAMEEKGLIYAGEQQAVGAVTIMSIHKSKGLEFPVVLLCGLSRSFNQESARAQVLCDKELGLGLCCVDPVQRVRFPTIAKRAIAAKIMSDCISEEMRVLYVAMTRAKDRLIMTYAVKNLDGELQDIAMRLDMSSQQLMTGEVDCPGAWVLQTALRRTEAGELFAIGGHPDCVSFREPVWSIHVSQPTQTSAVRAEQELQMPEFNHEWTQKLKDALEFTYPYQAATLTPSKQTATQLKGRVKDQEAAEDTGVISTAARKFRKPEFVQQARQGKDYGSAIHAVMQYIRYEVCSDADAVENEIARLADEGMITQEQKQLADAKKIAKLFSTQIGKKLRSGGEILREFKFSILDDASRYFPDTQQEQILLQGVVDCALIEADGITVIDFKTDYVTDKTLDTVVARYHSQVTAYAGALQRIYRMPIKAVLLYFFHLDRFISIECP